MTRRKNEQGGFVLIEATYIIVLITFVVAILIGFMLVIFQKYQVQVLANQAAARIGRLYPYIEVEPTTGKVSRYDILNTNKIFSSTGLFRNFGDGQKSTNANRAQDYAEHLMASRSLMSPTSQVVEATVVTDSFAKRHIEVKIQATFKVPMGGFFKFFGLPGETTYTATGRAECVDMLDYVNAVSYANFLHSELEDLPIVGDVYQIIMSFKSLFG